MDTLGTTSTVLIKDVFSTLLCYSSKDNIGSVLIREASLFSEVPNREVPMYMHLGVHKHVSDLTINRTGQLGHTEGRDQLDHVAMGHTIRHAHELEAITILRPLRWPGMRTN